MNNGSNDTNQFSAEDIRRYHAGEMPSHEMHELEKAALEDPFLADAMEGYTYTATPKKDIEELRSKLLAREQDKKVISLPVRKRSFYAPLKVAALALLLAGAGWVVYQFTLPKENDVAVNKTELKQTDSMSSSTPELTADDGLTNTITVNERESNSIASGKNKQSKKDITDQSPESSSIQKTEALADQDADVTRVENKTSASPAISRRTSGVRLSTANLSDSTTVFKGRIVNAEDKPVPYATINIANAGKGVSTDAQGYFTISTQDSVLKADVNAIGYQTNKLNLNNAGENHKVVLQESNQSLQEVVVTANRQSRRKEVVNRSATNISDIEPVDGIEEYNEYLSDNIKKTKDKNKLLVKGEVVLLFNVNDGGMPVNITVEKSLCAACDEEAIRLLKEGPKWQKQQEKKGRIVIRF